MIIWNPAPEIFSLGSIAPRWYGLAFVIGFFISEKYVSKIMCSNGFTKDHVSKLFTYILIGTILGARLGHCLFYEPSYYLSHPLEILMIWKGGLASHGGFIGVMVASWLFNKKVKEIDYIWLLDVVAAPALMTGGFIRLGNLMNSEILGRASDLPWAVVFKRIDNIPRHPAQVYESIGFFIISGLVYFLYHKHSKTWPKGRFVGIILALGMTHRFFIEFFKENQVAFEQSMTFNMGQLLSVPMFLLGLYLIFRNNLKSRITK
jgi:prolipoprotein diacylglyceryl transferase